MQFSQIAVLLVTATTFGIIARALKQPLLVGYLFAGVFLSVFGLAGEIEVISGLGQIGVALLLFLVGLELNPRELKDIGKPSLLTGLGQIIFTSTLGFALALILGFEALPALYIAIALTFSSTIIMVKLLSEKNDLNSLYGRLSIGFLLVQDFVALIILMVLSGMTTGETNPLSYIFLFAKGGLLLLVVWLLSKKILPTLFEKTLARSTELLFIGSVAWALGVASFIAGPLGFSLEIGGFLAGIALANLPEHLAIASRTKPLRDFFLVIFFLALGAQLVVGDIFSILPVALIFSAFVLIGNPLIVMAIMGTLGYRKRTSFLAGLTVAQISEFSIVLMTMGMSIGHVTSAQTAVVVVVGIITMTLSTYMTLEADKLYRLLKDYLSIFEKKHSKEAVLNSTFEASDHIVLAGCSRAGGRLLKFFQKKSWPTLVIDFDPRIFTRLSADNAPIIFGDVNDPEIIDNLFLNKARALVSTITSITDNLMLLDYVKSLSTRPITIFVTHNKRDAISLYEAGATYVVVPEVAAGDHMKHIFKTYGSGSVKLKNLGKRHFKRLLK